MAAPQITPLPTPPVRSDAPADFAVKADNFAAALPQFVTETNASAAFVDQRAIDADASATAAAASEGAAASSVAAAADQVALATEQAGLATTNGQAQVALAAEQVDLAADQVALAAQEADRSESAAGSAEVSAAAAGAAAGLPALVGNAGKALIVKTNESGVEFGEVGQKIGDILITAREPDATYLAANNVYLQAAYPELFSVVGLKSNIYESVARSLPTTEAWISVTYGNGLFVAVAQGGTIAATSPDGITWTQRALPASATWASVTYGSGLFVAVAQSSAIAATSPDGITWTQRALPASATWISVTYGSGLFVAVAQNSAIAAALNLFSYDPATQFYIPAIQLEFPSYVKALESVE